MFCEKCLSNKHWNGGDPKCCFNKDGSFESDNWMCGVIQHLRFVVEGVESVNVEIEETCKVIKHTKGFIVLTWYKEQCSTNAFFINDNTCRPMTYNDYLEIE